MLTNIGLRFDIFERRKFLQKCKFILGTTGCDIDLHLFLQILRPEYLDKTTQNGAPFPSKIQRFGVQTPSRWQH